MLNVLTDEVERDLGRVKVDIHVASMSVNDQNQNCLLR